MSTNKTTQFTPGPWVINTFTVDGQNKLEVLDANGGNACVQANATLIAAAPAMYEALQATLAYFLRSKQTHAPEVQIIRQAIAQAEGH